MNNQIIASTQDALSIGDIFHKSGMFPDIKTSQMAVVKIMAGREMGISPFAAMGGIHIISGKATIGAGLMAARVKSFGKYDYKVVKHDDTICSIDFYQGKEKLGNSTFTIADAKRAETKNIHKFPKNMLFARALSNGVKWFTPDIYEQPVYVPEEMDTVVEDAAPNDVTVVKNTTAADLVSYTADDALAEINTATNRESLTTIWNAIPSQFRAFDSVITAAKDKSTSFDATPVLETKPSTPSNPSFNDL